MQKAKSIMEAHVFVERLLRRSRVLEILNISPEPIRPWSEELWKTLKSEAHVCKPLVERRREGLMTGHGLFPVGKAIYLGGHACQPEQVHKVDCPSPRTAADATRAQGSSSGGSRLQDFTGTPCIFGGAEPDSREPGATRKRPGKPEAHGARS